ncbi:MAG: carboxypeptidase regulatory-like domain-containing protein, partial [Nitrospira sp.]|nr:carboxypeptidase regulatory-like domain-containing protein [Nitrospira sp.]
MLQPFTVSPNGGFQNVVVSLINIEKGKKFEAPTPRIEAIDCKFEPYITVVRDQHKVDVVNLDPVMHDIQAYETSDLGARVLFNVPLPMSERLTKSELLK